MPEYVVRRTMEVLNKRKKALNGANILSDGPGLQGGRG